MPFFFLVGTEHRNGTRLSLERVPKCYFQMYEEILCVVIFCFF